MQLQALLLISAQEKCNQAKVNSKSHYQWKRMISCAQNAVRPATHGEWFNSWLELSGIQGGKKLSFAGLNAFFLLFYPKLFIV